MTVLNALIIEDMPQDAELLVLQLQRGGFELDYKVVDNRQDFLMTLKSKKWDIIFSDHNLPDFSSTEALELVNAQEVDIPFIIISGTIGEEVAVEAMRMGASDYLMKGNLARLVPAVQRELRDSQERQARKHMEVSLRESEDRFRIMADSAPVLIWMADDQGKAIFYNKSWEAFSRRPREMDLGLGWQDLIHPEDLQHVVETYMAALQAQDPFRIEARLRRYDGVYRWFQVTAMPRFMEHYQFAGLIGTFVDVTELKEAKDAAERVSKRKSEFLAMLSHELRTPLNAIIGYSEMMSTGKTGDMNEKQHKYLNNVVLSSKHLLDLVNEILDVAKIEAGKITITPELIDIRPFLNEMVDFMRAPAAAKQVEMYLEIDSGLSQILADGHRLRQVLLNLLSNAIKFNREGGHVRLRAKGNDEEGVTFEVEDTGIGIPKEKCDELFTEFYQVDTSYSRHYDGIGLGMFISKKLVERMGGSLSVQSEVGRGTRFTCSFRNPVSQVDASKPEVKTLPIS